jgi:aminoglycoside phosphotransferase (APT) family kinase protein
MARQGVRIAWSEMPTSVRSAVDTVLGSPVEATREVSGGFSPGPAVRAELLDGRTVFVKAAGSSLNEQSPVMHRHEAAVLGTLPPNVPAPRLLGVVDDGDWVALIIEWVDGRMPVAADSTDVQRLFALLRRVADAVHSAELGGIGTVAETHADLFGHWQLLAVEPDPRLDDWSRRHIDRLAELDAVAPAATVGSNLLHVDVRTDNVILAESGSAGDVLVDWPGASLGAAWVDLVVLLPALHLDGGPPPWDVFGTASVADHADPVAVDAFVAALAGYFTRQSLLPPPPGLPTVRAFQAAQGAIARTWTAHRLQLS